ncbi:hypothetical protein [Microbulbifer agarilyticus]|uniref:hypothetical protein n=1 Tax=Microbulbifer agarilyticus TaxID=260552 RepID=UPI001C937ED0|nr:hypothetical protein [Microbulbifer agarilyticus]MBY6190430.1 hypothetical protein [Microbulbifer agarilyticus]MCA0899373.1 hypothetical protein [Microbulbifer agarilyticus]
MGTQKQALAFLSFFLLSACGESTASNLREITKEEKDFRKYATAICLGSSFSEKSIRADANRSANVYMGNVDLAAYEALRAQLKNWKPTEFTTKNGSQAAITRCIEFSESKEVKQLFNEFDPCSHKEAWLDQTNFDAQCE